MSPHTLQSTHPTHNPDCDGCNCTSPASIVRIVKLDDSANAHLCPDCYKHEVEEGDLYGYPYSIFPSLSPEKQGAPQ